MATLLKCGGLFLHVPKTGGNWVSDVLAAHDLVYAHVGGKHAGPPQLAPLERLLQTAHRYDRTNRPLFKFCFVRHPLRWYESWYCMNVARGWPEWAADEEAWNPTVELNGYGAPTFNGFIEDVLRRRPGFVSELYDYYARDAHFVGRQEHMVDDLGTVLDLLHVPVARGRLRAHRPVNVSSAIDVTLDTSLRDALEAAEATAYTRYGYTGGRADLQSWSPHSYEPFPPSTLPASPFVAAGGAAWRVALPALSCFSDTDGSPCRSMLSLLEDGIPLAHPHALHDDVRQVGQGHYSHWGTEVLFSTSDNSDPNRNGRRYAIAWGSSAPAHSTTLLLQTSATPTGAAL